MIFILFSNIFGNICIGFMHINSQIELLRFNRYRSHTFTDGFSLDFLILSSNFGQIGQAGGRRADRGMFGRSVVVPTEIFHFNRGHFSGQTAVKTAGSRSKPRRNIKRRFAPSTVVFDCDIVRRSWRRIDDFFDALAGVEHDVEASVDNFDHYEEHNNEYPVDYPCE